MTKSQMAAKMQQASAWLPGKRIKLDFGAEGVIMLDGVSQHVTEDEGAADTTIKVGWDDLQKLRAGELDPMTAFMGGRLRIDGDLSNAMQLQAVFSKLRQQASS